MTPRLFLRRANAALLLAFLAACNNDNDVTSPATLKLTPDATSLSITPGTTAATEVLVERTGSFTGDVEVVAEGLPAGFTATVTPIGPMSGNMARSRITITAPANAAAGAAGNVTIRARAPGLPEQSSTVAVNVVALQSFTVSVPTPLVIQPGTSIPLTATITRVGGYAGPVSVSLEGLPAGVTVDTVIANGNTAVLTVRAAPTAAAQSVNVVARGKAANLLDYSTTINLRVAGYTITGPAGVAASEGTSVTYTVPINRSEFASDVTVSLEGLPAGVTASAPVVTSGNSAQFTITVPTGQTLGYSNFTVRARATGLSDRTQTVRLTVAPPGLGGTLVASGVGVPNLSGAINTVRTFRIYVPPGSTSLVIRTTGATSDIDLYARFNAIPGLSSATDNCVQETASGNETCTITNPTTGTWYARIFAFEAYAGVTFTATVTP